MVHYVRQNVSQSEGPKGGLCPVIFSPLFLLLVDEYEQARTELTGLEEAG